ncbi:MAG: DUF975 family protein [Actinomycetota bacterium]
MASDRYSKGEAIRFGWEAMKNNFVFFLLFLIVAWVVSGGLSALGSINRGSGLTVFPFIFGVLGWLVGILISMAQTTIGLRLSAAPEATAEVSDVWSSWGLFLNYFVGGILVGLMVMVGFIFCIIPGIYLGIRFSFFGYLIIDRNIGPVEAIKRSWEITSGNTWDLFLLGLLFFGIILLGVLACVVGLFAAIPTTMVAHAYVYRRLEYGAVSGQVPQAPETVSSPEA